MQNQGEGDRGRSYPLVVRGEGVNRGNHLRPCALGRPVDNHAITLHAHCAPLASCSSCSPPPHFAQAPHTPETALDRGTDGILLDWERPGPKRMHSAHQFMAVQVVSPAGIQLFRPWDVVPRGSFARKRWDLTKRGKNIFSDRLSNPMGRALN